MLTPHFADLRPRDWDDFARQRASASRLCLVLEVPIEEVERLLAEAEARVQPDPEPQSTRTQGAMMTPLLERPNFLTSRFGRRMSIR